MAWVFPSKILIFLCNKHFKVHIDDRNFVFIFFLKYGSIVGICYSQDELCHVCLTYLQ